MIILLEARVAPILPRWIQFRSDLAHSRQLKTPPTYYWMLQDHVMEHGEVLLIAMCAQPVQACLSALP